MENNRNVCTKRYSEEHKEEALAGDNSPIRKKPRLEVVSTHSFAKNFYVPHANVVQRSEEDNNHLRSALAVRTIGRNVPAMVQTLQEANFPHSLTLALDGLQLNQVTNVQAQAWPIVLSGRDLLGIGHSGSGKSLTFGVPALIHVRNQRYIHQAIRPIALICAPSTIHVEQLEIVFRKIVASSRIGLQCKHIRNASSITRNFRYDIILGTAPILSSFIRINHTIAQRCTFVVFDDIDRMIDLRQEVHIRHMLHSIRTDRQLLIWTNICNAEVQSIADEFLNSECIRMTVSLSPPDPVACMSILTLELHLRKILLETKRVALNKRQIQLFLNRLTTIRDSSAAVTFAEAMRQTTHYVMDITRYARNVLHRIELAYNDLEYEHERFFGQNIFPLECGMVMEHLRSRQPQEDSDNE